MSRINKHNYGGSSLPALRADDLEGATAATLTITGATEGRIPDYNAPGGSRTVLRITFAEFPEKVYYANPAGVTACVEEFGEYTEEWEGQTIPLIVRETINPATKRTVTALHIAPRDEWEGIMSGTGEVPSESESGARARKTARKR